MIDVHTHAVPGPNSLGRISSNIYRLEPTRDKKWGVYIDDEFMREVDATAFDVDARVAAMDDEGVEHQLVSPTPFLLRYTESPDSARELGRLTNHWIATMSSAAPGRLSGLGTVTLQEPKMAVDDLCNACDVLVLRGVLIGTHTPTMELSDPSLNPFWEAAEDRGALLLIHPWTSRLLGVNLPNEQFALGYPAATATAFTAMVAARLTERFPNIRWLLSHGGGCAGSVVGRLQKGSDSLNGLGVPGPLSPLDVLRSCWLDSLVYDPYQLASLVTLLGHQHIVMGTDFPFVARERPSGSTIRLANQMGLVDGDIAQDMLKESAIRLLGINP